MDEPQTPPEPVVVFNEEGIEIVVVVNVEEL